MGKLSHIFHGFKPTKTPMVFPISGGLAEDVFVGIAVQGCHCALGAKEHLEDEDGHHGKDGMIIQSSSQENGGSSL